MGTSAMIAIEKSDGTYDWNHIHFDGYLNGVGKKLAQNWNDIDKVINLCVGNEIRSLEHNFEDTEFYPKYDSLYKNKERRNISFEKLCNLANNFDYTYVFNDEEIWMLLDLDKCELIDYEF